MRKLLPFRLLLRNPRFPTLSRSQEPSTSPIPDLRPFSGFLTGSSFRSWQSLNIPSSSLGFLACRALSKQAVVKPQFLALLETGIRSLKVSLQRKPFDPRRLFFGSTRSFWRHWLPTPDGAVLGLIGVNVAVFFLWRIADPKFMRDHFMISLDNVKSGRLHTLLTSAFSHSELDHIVSNMIGLYFFGTSIARMFGAEFLLKLYVAGALSGSIFFLLHKGLIAPSSQAKGIYQLDYSRVPGLGASAAVNAIILLQVFLFPKEIYYVNLIIPVPAMLMGAIIIGTDLWRVKKGEGDISGSAHLGGAVVAALVWAGIKKGWI